MPGLMTNLRQGQRGDEVEPERPAKVPPGDLVGLDDELAAAEHTRRRRDEGGAEAEQDVRGVEEVQQRADHGERERQRVPELDAHVVLVPLRARQVQEQRVHEQRQQAGGQEDLVPQVDQLPARVEEEVAAAAGGVQQGLQLLREGARQHPVLQRRVPARLLQAAAAETQPAFPGIVNSAVLSAAEVRLQRVCSEALDLDLVLKPEISQRSMQMHGFRYEQTMILLNPLFSNVALFSYLIAREGAHLTFREAPDAMVISQTLRYSSIQLISKNGCYDRCGS